MPSELSEPANRFIGRHIRSMNSLELLLYMRDHADAGISARQVTEALRGNAAAMADMLTFFKSHELLAEDAPGMFHYRPRTPDDETVLAELAWLFRQRPVALMDAILASPSDKIRSFADAFRIKGE